MQGLFKVMFALTLIIATSGHLLTKEDIMESVCQEDNNCAEGAKRCLGAIKPTPQETKNISDAFQSCVSSLKLKDLLQEFRERPTNETSTATEEMSEEEWPLYMYLPFTKYLEKEHPSSVDQFRCCFGKTTKSLDENDNINKDYFLEKISQRVTQDNVMEALVSGINECSPQATGCNFQVASARKGESRQVFETSEGTHTWKSPE